MTLYFLVIVSAWGIATSSGELITHADAKKIGVFHERERCISAMATIAYGLENGQEAHCIEYRLGKDGKSI